MLIFPAIDLYEGKAVRLYKGNYDNMTIYSNNPVEIAKDFKNCGAEHIHIVDLEGARFGTTPNLDVVCRIKNEAGLFCEIGGGVRSMQVVDTYINSGIDRVILGTAALNNPKFLKEAAEKYGEKIAVGADIKDGFIAVKGWIEKSDTDSATFFKDMEDMGIKNIICTDISRDGAMQGTNRELYKSLSKEFNLDITASGGVSSIDDIIALTEMGLYGAIIGKAYYEGAIDLKKAIEVSK